MAIYTPLKVPNREIRLLLLRPGTAEQPLYCSLSVVSLDNAVTYEALSYVWGSSDSNTSIELDGEPFRVTPNLHAALKRLRHVDKTRTLWVDAVCINQADTAEKNAQVSMMSSIYGGATAALLWLGEEPDVPVPIVNAAEADRMVREADKHLLDLAAALDTWQWEDPDMAALSGDLRRVTETQAQADSADEFLITPTRPHIWYGDDRDLSALSEASENPNLRADSIFHAFALFRLLAANHHLDSIPYLVINPDRQSTHLYPANALPAAFWLITRSWWSRIWTVQECILPRRCTVLYGPVSMPWDVLLDGLFNFQHHRDTCCAQLPGVHDMLNAPLETVLELRALRMSRGGVSLARLLPKFRYREATDPRDKVYALLPLVTEWYGAMPLVPAYEKPVEEVYTETVGGLIRISASLDVLCRPPDLAEQLKLPSLPSWVIDLNWAGPAGASLDRLEKQLPLYDACGDTTLSNAQFYDGGKVLALEGLRIDRLKRCSTLAMYRNRLDAINCINWWHKVAEEELGKIDFRWSERFARTLCADTTLTHGPEERHNGFRRAAESDYQDIGVWLDRIRSCSPNEPDDENGGRLSRVVKAAIQMRVFVVTEKNRMGLVPNSARITFPRPDEIFIFPGGKSPFILRDVGIREIPGVGLQPCYSFLGDCYIDGVMDGEGIGDLNAEKKTVYIV
ncbi:heterokaryon incompatibility protein-domain-containing protein [Echria macrotheca]|uniref:Heterokaryon incompatibility protein-domain-containing protein n=1 Tax=Echria macrotheca TaxID=438768 RepID=A0AAJ0B2I4_9PEZI|nr:heterokaryon incompatibility protein-domain-containing protein [Echria macrotheca]